MPNFTFSRKIELTASKHFKKICHSQIRNITLGGIALSLAFAGSLTAEPIHLPTDRKIDTLFRSDTLVTSGFSGTKIHKPFSQEGQADEPVRPVLRELIDLDGAVVTLLRIDQFDGGASGQEIKRTPYDTIIAGQVGQIFGLALDDETRPNLYLGATSAFGLYINGADRNEDMLPDRLRKGAGDAVWSKGQFGSLPESGPGSVYKIDGRTGQISLLLNILLEGVANSGPGLGNIAYDNVNKVLFVSDLDTGLIHRVTPQGDDLETFDHGTQARPNEDLDPALHDPTDRMDITTADFDPDLPDTWGFAKAERRVWGLAVHRGRLFYTVAQGVNTRPEIWSVGLHENTGVFLNDAQWEVSLPERFEPFDISDLAFTSGGSLIVAQRGTPLAPFDYKKMAQSGQAVVARFVREDPNDPRSSLTPSDWVDMPIDYNIGFSGPYANSVGGIALGPNYTARGRMDRADCRGTLWASGDALRLEPTLETTLLEGGALSVHGVQGQPIALDARTNTPPWVSYFHDFDSAYEDDPVSGHLGDVEVLGCVGANATPPVPEDVATFDFDDTLPEDPKLCKSASCVTFVCLINPAACLPKQNACMSVEHTVTCDPATGMYVLNMQASDRLAAPVLDQLKFASASPPLLGVPTQTTMSSPVSLPLAGFASGQVGHVALCAFNGADQATGEPYDCCNQTVSFKTPGALCEKEAN